MSTDSPDNLFVDFPDEFLTPTIERFRAAPLPAAHPAEAGVFARHQGVAGHSQADLLAARVLLVGAGGINGWAGAALARSGVGKLTIVDPDVVDRTNLSRQLFYGSDLGSFKASQLAKNLLDHATTELEVTAIASTFEQAIDAHDIAADVFLVGVDSNPCRLAAAKVARRRRIPAVFALLSTDGMRWQAFLQGPGESDACLWCALPNLNPSRHAPCVPAVVTSAMSVGSASAFLVHRALMGWPTNTPMHNWREADLLGLAPERVGIVSQRADCEVCGSP